MITARGAMLSVSLADWTAIAAFACGCFTPFQAVNLCWYVMSAYQEIDPYESHGIVPQLEEAQFSYNCKNTLAVLQKILAPVNFRLDLTFPQK